MKQSQGGMNMKHKIWLGCLLLFCIVLAIVSFVGLAPKIALVKNAEDLSPIKFSVQEFLDKVYPSYNHKKSCWITENAEGLDEGYTRIFCMKVDSFEQKILKDKTNRFYLILTGQAIDDEDGELIDSHGTPGLVSAFIIEQKNGKTNLIASGSIMLGAFGGAPREWKLIKLGPSDYWGWLNTSGYCTQGYCIGAYTILAPFGKHIRDLTPDIRASYSDTGASGDSSLESSIKTEITEKDKIYPLLIKVTGIDEGVEYTPKTWRFTFDRKKWRYKTPVGYPMKDF